MSLKKWFKAKRLGGLFGLLAMLFVILLMVIGVINGQRNTNRTGMSAAEDFFLIVWMACMICAVVGFMVYDDYSRKTQALQKHLGVDNLRQYIELSPSQMEDMCLRRLKVLGYAWDEAIKNYPKPFADERADAESTFRSAEWFFRKHKCIKPTKWDPFFPKQQVGQ